MELYGGIPSVTKEELISMNLLTPAQYDHYIREKKLSRARRGGGGHYALIDFNSLPEWMKVEYKRQKPDAEKELIREYMSCTIQSDDAAVKFYREYQPAISIERQQEYVLTAQVLNEMVRVEKAMKADHKIHGSYLPKETWNAVIGTCENLRKSYRHNLPNNEARLRQKFNAYKREGYSCLVNKNSGNQVARKISGEEARLILKLRRSKFPIYTEAQLFEEYNRQAVERGLNIIKSPVTLRNFLFDPAIMPMWYASVYGMPEWKKKYIKLMKTDLPQMRDALWYGDGTKLNLYYKGENGKKCTTMVYEVVDAYSEVLLGFGIAPTENFRSQYEAYRMAIEVSGARPYELVHDNQGSHSKLASQGFFDKICRLSRPTMPYNPQSKTIENIFGRFQQQVLHKRWNYTGGNVTDKKLNSKPNLEFINQNDYKLPPFDELVETYIECRNEWNNMPHPATGIPRMEMYLNSENPEALPVTELDKVRMFWLTKDKPSTYTNAGISFEIAKREYQYEVYTADGLPDYNFSLKNTGREFMVKYDPMDMTHIELFEQTASGMKYRATATPKVSVSRATQEQTSEDRSLIVRTIQLSKEVLANVQLEGEDFDLSEKIAAEFFDFSTPNVKNLSRKEMDKFRDKHKTGQMKPILGYPKIEKEIEAITVDYSSTGEYTKAISNITYDTISEKF